LPGAPEASKRFGERIRALRQARSRTQKELAAAAGIDFTYLSKVENGHGEPPSEETIRRLARELNGEEEELLALAVKVPDSLRVRATTDPKLALLLRRLPSMPSTRLQSVYRAAGIGTNAPSSAQRLGGAEAPNSTSRKARR